MKKLFTRLALFFAVLFSSFSAYGQYIDMAFNLSSSCEPAQISMYDYSYIPAITGDTLFNWYIDDILVSNDRNPVNIPISKGYHDLRLDVYDSFGPRFLGSSYRSVTIYAKVNDFNVSTGKNACPGEAVLFSVDDVYSAKWDFGYFSYLTSTTSNNTYESHTYDKPGVYTVTLITQNFCGIDTTKKVITIADGSTPVLKASDVYIESSCVNDPIKFSTANEFSSYLWEFGDGGTSTQPLPEYTYKSAIAVDFTGKLTVTNICGGSASVTFPVQIQSGLVANASFSYNPEVGQNICPGSPIRFTPFGTGTYFWDFGDGSTSRERNPVHIFSQTREYPVTLIVTNGCMNVDSVTNYIYIETNPQSYIAYPYFSFDAPSDKLSDLGDTLFLCTGETAKFINYTFSETGSSGNMFSWDFGENGGNNPTTFNASYIYANPGTYTVFLNVSNLCGATQASFPKYVVVDPGTKPKAVLMSTPPSICAGDKVYFWDQDFDPRNNYRYSVVFGDGNTLNDITKIQDLKLNTLASHTYGAGGPYNFTFSAKNSCGNSLSLNGVITVDNNTGRKPFYYIGNSTENPSTVEPENWSKRRNPTDYEIDIPVNWTAWIPEYGNDFFIFLWYGSFNPSGNQEVPYPDGVVHFTSASMESGTTVKAFVPISPVDPMSVGIAAGYFCGGVVRYGEEPEAFGSLVQDGFYSIPSIPIIPSGSTNLSTLNMSIPINPNWNGVCKSDIIEDIWFKEVEPGVYAKLYLIDGFSYEMTYTSGTGMDVTSNYYGNGYYNRISKDTIEFYNFSGCVSSGFYKIVRPDKNTLQLIPVDDPCNDRKPFMEGTFTRTEFNPYDYLAACPGDLVAFTIAGGVSYAWNFGDGKTSTEQHPLHAYAVAGKYTASVIATNSCGRKDTLYTYATVASKKPSPLFFTTVETERIAGDSLHFYVESFTSGTIENNTYLWNFGDGVTSTLAKPVHVFKKAGEYKVNLTVTNGCGSNTRQELLYIQPRFDLCDARFEYFYGGEGSVSFSDRSLGNPKAWTWDFGDGSNSTQSDPNHSYARDGIYEATLTIINPDNKCLSSVTRKVIVGYNECQADFEAVINTNSGLTTFFTKSIFATAYYWDFGDGEFSNEANPEHSYTKTGVYKVSLTIWDSANSCQSNIIKDINFIPVGQNFIMADYSFFTNPDSLTISLSDLSSENTTNWYWTMGDGKVLKSRNPEYTYSKPGIYNVCLTVYDNISSLSRSACKDIRIGNIDCNLTSDFEFFINPLVRKVEFFSKVRGEVDKYFWTFGDGSTSTSDNPVKQYLEPGYYKVSLSVRNTADKCIAESSQFIQVGSADCRAGFAFRVEPVNPVAHFQDNSKGEADYYFWEFGDGNFSILKNPDHLYKNSGLYNVSQTIIDVENDCMDNFMQAVQIGEISCAADFVNYIDSANFTAYFTNRVLGDFTALLWSFGDGKLSTQQNPWHKFPGPGLYSTGLNTYDLNTGCMDYYEELLLIGKLERDCNADFIYRVNPTTSEVVFNNTSTGNIVKSLWNFGDDSENSTETNPHHTYSKGGYYYVSLSVFNSSGVKNMGGKWILVQANNANECKADFMFTIDSTTRKVKFVDRSFGDIDKYSWDFDDSSADSVSFLKNPVHTYNQKGYYTVKLKVENTTTKCQSSEFKLINVAEVQRLKASFGYEAFPPDKKRAGYPVDLVSSSSGDGATVEWDFGDKSLKKAGFTVMDSTTGILTHYYELPGKYRVCLRITDPISNQVDEYCNYVYTKGGVGIEETFENGFSLDVYPNPLSDYTTVNYSIEKPQFIEVAIFDQLGRKIETLEKARKDSGGYQIVWEPKSLTSGVYYLKLLSAEGVFTRQLVIAK